MNFFKSNSKSIFIILGICVLGLLLGFGISKIFTYTLNDVLFVEGIFLIILGFASSLSGNSKGLSMQSLGSINSQYAANANLEITKMEREKTNVKDSLTFAFSNVSLISAGVVCLIVTYIFL